MESESHVVALYDTGEPRAPVPLSVAHQAPGMLHLAVSVQLVDSDGRWLLQRRARAKRPFGGLWANSSCTHPLPDETPEDAARRRLREELGLDVAELTDAGSFTYRAEDAGSGMVEHETDRVYLARAPNDALEPAPEQIDEVAWLSFEDALALVSGDEGAPWAARVLQLAREVLRAP